MLNLNINPNMSGLPSSDGSDSPSPYKSPAVKTTANVAQTNSLLVDPNGQNPSQIAAQLLNAQFANWESAFMPLEMAAMQEVSTNNPAVLTKALDLAKTEAEGASSMESGILGRELSAQGVKPTNQQSEVMKRILDIDKSLNVAGAENQARSTQRTLNEQILMGSAPNPNIINAATNPVSKV